MWITPKTNWTNNDYFNVTGSTMEAGATADRNDYGRIRNNMLVLRDLVYQKFGGFDFINMAGYGYDGIPFADFYNSIERNIDGIAAAGYKNRDMEATKTWRENRKVWDSRDLNRIERTMQLLYDDLLSFRRLRLKIMLGGGNIYYG